MADPVDKKSFHLLIDPDALIEAKVRCVRESLNLSDVISELLKMWVDGKCKVSVKPSRRKRRPNR